LDFFAQSVQFAHLFAANKKIMPYLLHAEHAKTSFYFLHL